MSKLIPLERELKGGDMVWLQMKPDYVPEIIILATDQMAQNFNAAINNPSGVLNLDKIKQSRLLFLIDPPLPGATVGQPYRIGMVQNGLNVGDTVYNHGTKEFTIINEQNLQAMTQTQKDGYNQKPPLPTYILQEYKPFNAYMAEVQKMFNR